MMAQLLSMVAGTLAGVAAVFFLRFWRQTRDRFFLIFASAFLTLSAHWSILAIVRATGDLEQQEHAFHHYGVRLLGFVLIAVAIIDKNRR